MSQPALFLEKIRNGDKLGAREQRRLILFLAWPAILAHISVTVMQLIDAAMVGRLGTDASAAIGLMSSTTWLVNGVLSGINYGFSVQCAQAIGAGDIPMARRLCRQGLLAGLVCSLVVGGAGAAMSAWLPVWLGGSAEIVPLSAGYIRIYFLALPFSLLNSCAVVMLQSAGDTKVPGLAEIVMCGLDVAFNAWFIYGMGLGVVGAALGTAASVVAAGLFLVYRVLCRDRFLKGRVRPQFSRDTLLRAVRIGVPVSAEQLITGSSYVVFTRIVSGLGTVAIAANSFAVTAESLCYMPGYGTASAASAIVGQCVGAGRTDLTRQISWRITRTGIGMMAVSGVVMFVLAPWLMALLTNVPEVISMGTDLLRLEAFSEPMYGASIVIIGILRGRGETVWPAVLSFLSIWCVRIPLAAWLASVYGLFGAWVAMGIELNFRGVLFLLRLHRTSAQNGACPDSSAGRSASKKG